MSELLDQLQQKQQKLAKLLRTVELARGGDRDQVRSRDALRKQRQSTARRDVVVPPCANRRRRNRLEKDDCRWLQWYCPDIFWYRFTMQQLGMIEAIVNAIRYGGDQAIAASRGEGKTKIFERLLLKYALTGTIAFAVLFAANKANAMDCLDSIKQAIETSERLAADYPEVCTPVRALENVPNRAHYQVVSGKRHDNGKPYEREPSRFSWCGHEIVFPNVPGSPSAGAIIATRGLDSAVRGLNKFNRRVDLAGIDDPDTEETVNSEDQAEKLERRIDRAIVGLGGQQRGVARVMLTTLQRRQCVSAKFTDPAQKPSWKGKRFRYLVKPPDRTDLWDAYVAMRQEDLQTRDADGNPKDPFARRSHRYYVEHREEMDAGSIVANEHRYNAGTLPDGSQIEASALEHYYNEVARIGSEAVATEYDNDPPEESGLQEHGLTAFRIQRQTSGFLRAVIPPGCTLLTQGLDVRKVAMHWVVRAWKLDEHDQLLTGYTIDYGIQDVWGTTAGSEEGIGEAIVRAAHARAVQMQEHPYCDKDGQPRPIDLTLVDAGWKTEDVYEACKELGIAWRPSMGFGKSNGCVQTSFSPPVHPTPDKKMGDRWFLSRRPKGTWLVCTDADFWKSWEHDRWLSDPQQPGALLLFGEPPSDDRYGRTAREHTAYAHHIVSELEVEDLVKGVLKRYWKVKSHNNHWLDASCLANVAASMKGMRRAKGGGPVQTMEAGEWFKG